MKAVASQHIREKSDFVVILGNPKANEIAQRIHKGVELLRTGASDRLLLVGSDPEVKEMRRIASKLGIEEKSIFTNGDSATTIDNAFFTKLECMNRSARSMVLVTSRHGMPRALFIFRKMLGEQFRVTAEPIESASNKGERREAAFRHLLPLLYLFRNGDHMSLKKASDSMLRALDGPGISKDMWSLILDCNSPGISDRRDDR